MPVRMTGQNRFEKLQKNFAACVQSMQGQIALAADDFERRGDGCHIPARIALRIFVAGREIGAASRIESLENVPEPARVGDFRAGASDTNAVRGGVTQLGHIAAGYLSGYRQ